MKTAFPQHDVSVSVRHLLPHCHHIVGKALLDHAVHAVRLSTWVSAIHHTLHSQSVLSVQLCYSAI